MPDRSLDVLVRILTQEVGEGKADEIMKKYNEEVKNSAEGAKLFSGEAREMHRITGELNKVLPGCGQALREAFNPTALGGVGILVGLIVKVKEAVDNYNKSLDDAAAKAAQPLDGGIKAVQDAWDEATKSLAKYLTELNTAGQQDQTGVMIKRIEALDKAQLDADVREIESAGKLEVARIRAMEAGHKNPSQIEADVAAAEARTQAQIQQAKGNFTAAELQKQLDEAKAAQKGLEQAAEAAEKRAKAADATAERRETTLKNLREANAPGAAAGSGQGGLLTVGDLTEQQEVIDKLDQMGVSDKVLEQAHRALRRMEGVYANQQAAQKSIEAQTPAAENDKAAADAARDEARRNAEKNKARINTLPGEIAQAQATAAIGAGADEQTAADKAAADAANDIAARRKKGETANQEIEGGVTAQDDIETLRKAGFTPDKIERDYRQSVANKQAGLGTAQDEANIKLHDRLKQDQENIRALNELLTTMGENGERLTNIMRGHNYIAGNHASRIQQLEADYASIIARMNTAKP